MMYFSQFFASPFVRRGVLTLLLAPLFSSAIAQTKPQTPTVKPAPAAAKPAPATPAGSLILARGPGGALVRLDDVLSELRRAPASDRQAVLARPDAVQQIASNLLTRRVLSAEAQRDGLDKDPIIAATMAVARDRVLSDALMARLDAQNTPSEAALDAYAHNLYQANETKFDRPAQTRARQILLANSGPESLQKARDLVAQLRAGASFEELAKANSIDPVSAARGGDLGFFGAGQMVKPFEDALNKLSKPGDLSDPVESQFGYHIIRLEERREKGRQPYSEVRDQLMVEARTAILSEVRAQKVQALNKDFVFDTEAIAALGKPATR